MSDQRNEPTPFVEEGPSHNRQLAPIKPSDPQLAMALARAEIDTQVATARAFPRSIGQCLNDMTAMATMNPLIAEECIYAVPRGGKTLRGPSIRFAEIAAAAWGHSRDSSHVLFVDRIDGVVECSSTYHDLQNNMSSTKSVRRKIEKKRGRTSYDDDMINLAGAAGMSIARRNAILGVIPRFIWQQAVDAVEKVNRGDAKTLAERRSSAISYFAKINVPIEKVLKALDKASADDIDLDDLVTMKAWGVAIRSGEGSIDEIFPEERKPSGKQDLATRLGTLAGEGEGPGHAPQPTDPSPPNSAGAAASNQAPVEDPGLQPAAAAPATDPAAGKAASSPEAAKAAPAPSEAPKPASGPPSKANRSDERRAALIEKGGAVALKGHDSLMEWLDNLSPNDAALVTPAMGKDWEDLAGR